MKSNYSEFMQILQVYGEASNHLEMIRKRLNKDISVAESNEISYHHAVFRNMKNFLVTQINSMITETGYGGFKEEDMMLPIEIQNEQKKFKKWGQIAFDDESTAAEVPIAQRESFKGNPEDVFANAKNWEAIAFSSSSSSFVLPELSEEENKFFSSNEFKATIQDVLKDTANITLKSFPSHHDKTNCKQPKDIAKILELSQIDLAEISGLRNERDEEICNQEQEEIENIEEKAKESIHETQSA